LGREGHSAGEAINMVMNEIQLQQAVIMDGLIDREQQLLDERLELKAAVAEAKERVLESAPWWRGLWWRITVPIRARLGLVRGRLIGAKCREAKTISVNR
jgi:hypothetical protein